MKPSQKGLNAENIGLIYEIDTHCTERKEKISCNENIGKCIKKWLCWLIHDESTMEGEKKRKNKDEIDGYTHEKDRKSKRKKDSFCSEWLITNQENHEKEIDTHTDNSTKGSLKNEMQGHEIIKKNHAKKNPSEHKDIELCHLKCHRKSREEWHDCDLAVTTIL